MPVKRRIAKGRKQLEAEEIEDLFYGPGSSLINGCGYLGPYGDGFWRDVAQAMEQQFRRGQFTEGLVNGIERAGGLLAEYFPRQPDDRNELPNRIEEH